MSNFRLFADMIARRYDELAKGELFVSAIEPDRLWETYLSAFPRGTNPIFRERTEHDCSCCRGFVKRLGGIVAIREGKLESIWNVPDLPYPYNTVAAALNEVVLGQPIQGVFRTSERKYGARRTRELLLEGKLRTWDHFEGHVGNKHWTVNPAKDRGAVDTTVRVFRRGLEELSFGAMQQVVELIEAKALYRGEEHLPSVRGFMDMMYLYRQSDNKELFVWSNFNKANARFRNTVIGTLVQALTDGVDLEKAVAAFEKKVAPENYKRTKALITPRMIENATKEIREAGLEDALYRRFATIHDVSVNDVLFVDNSVKGAMKGGIEGLLLETVKPTVSIPKNGKEISGEQFLNAIVPKAKTIEVLLESRHLNNFVSLTAPVKEDAPNLFQWDNGFAWSYDGDVTDSIKERVKRAGGVVEGDLCCRLSWDYRDDLDFHMREPDGGHVYYGKVRKLSANGGMLDVDANGVDGMKKEPCENIFYADKSKMRPGAYRLVVHNFARRSDGRDFEVEVEMEGQVFNFFFEGVLDREPKGIARIIKGVDGSLTLEPLMPVTARSKDKWGLKTEQLVPVDTLLLSPNHWGGQKVGNKHLFFILKGCKNPDSARGFYNEFLRPSLAEHRKVLEVLGSKLKCAPSEEQLSGVGFSSTRKDTVTVVVDGRQTYNIEF